MYRWTSTDWETLVALSRERGIDPRGPALLMLEESGLDPANPGPPKANVGGLNQMSSANLASLGISRSEWLAMDAATQLGHVFDFWDSLAKHFNRGVFPGDAGALLGLNFLPGAWQQAGAGLNPDAVLAGRNGPYASYYADNGPLQNRTGTITVNTLRSYLARIAEQNADAWNAALEGIAAAEGRGSSGGGGGGGAVTLPPITIIGTPDEPPGSPGSSVASVRAASPLLAWLFVFGMLGWALSANGRLPAPGRA